MKKEIEKIELKKTELQNARNEFKASLKQACNELISKHIYNRKFKKCISYCIYGIYKDYLTQQEISEILLINRTDVVIAIADVQRWLKINECEVIQAYVEQINEMLNI